MNITFLLGNGFDRALGLETGYGAFYSWYCERPRDGLKQWVRDFRGEIDKYIHKDSTAEAYWSDAEYGLGQYTEKFTLETVENFIDCFDDFRDNLVEYLKEQQALVTSDLAKTMRTHFAPQLVDFFQEIDPSEKTTVSTYRNQDGYRESTLQFVCFNYTNAVDQVVTALGAEPLGEWRGSDGTMHNLKMGRLVHAHGTLEMWPIIGVCNTKYIKNQELLKSPLFKAVMKKSESITVSGQLWRRYAKETIMNSHIICVFGMSLGETDSDYWEMVAEWLAGDTKRRLIVFWYDTNATNIKLSIREKYTEVNRVKEKLRSYSNWDEARYSGLKNRIHVVIKPKKMFALPDECKAKKNDTSVLPGVTVEGETLVFDCGGAPIA